MSFWPTDTAGKIADAISVTAFVGSAATAIYTRIRGNAVRRAVEELKREIDRSTLLPVAFVKLNKLCKELTLLQMQEIEDRQARLIKFVGEIEGTLVQIKTYSRPENHPSILKVTDCFATYQANRTEYNLQTLHEQMWKLATELDFTIQQIRLGE